MTKPKTTAKIDVDSEIWSEDMTVKPEIVKKAGAEPAQPVTEPAKKPEKPVKMTIMGDPYLTDEQKKVLMTYEMNKIMSGVTTEAKTPLLIRYNNGSGEPAYAVLNCQASKVTSLWNLYRDNEKIPSVNEFLDKVKCLSSAPVFLGRDMKMLDLS